jgi:hypothetical protein
MAKGAEAAAKRSQRSREEIRMLPTMKTPVRTGLSCMTAVLYGPSKIGKSTFCSQAPGVLFLATEAGLNHLETFQVPINSWDAFLAACAEIAEGKHGFQTIVIDTIDNAYRLCSEHFCRKLQVTHESDLGYGKGFSLVNGEFHRVLTRLSHLSYGLWLISHAQDREVETRTGKQTRIEPTLPGKARKIALGLVDIVMFADVESSPGPNGRPVARRVLRTKPGANYEAGDRTGRLPETIPLDYPSFAAAYARAVAPASPTQEPAAAVSGTSAPKEGDAK